MFLPMLSNNLLEKILDGDKRAISRALSEVENSTSTGNEILESISSYIGHSYRIGVTGPPGAGKSSLSNQLTKYLVEKEFKVAIVAVDPTSPFTGGALLGDRVRMSEIGTNQNVFIRSMASRGSLGGLSHKASDAGDVFDAAQFDYTIFETVGVGQSELDVAKAVDTTIVVLVPESGDSIQAMKAGLMEIGDIFVINKSDRVGADQAVSSLRVILSMRDHNENTWLPPIVKTIATENKGIDSLIDQIFNHRTFLFEKKIFETRRLERLRTKIKDLVVGNLRKEFWNVDREFILESKIQKVLEGKVSPAKIVRELIDDFKSSVIY
jgi:LAO/AO transport system kinase